MDGQDESGAGLRWLFLDLNSYFASAEQHERPELRGRPLIVVPLRSDHTCAIAASIEAKTFGIRTGTNVREAKKLCPGLVIVEARPDLYVKLHDQVMEVLESHIPIDKVHSIDEAACRLMGPQQRPGEAMALARRIQTDIRAQIGPCLRSSVGIAPSKLLAKIASGMKKPDGLTILRQDELPGRLLDLPLIKLTGIGRNMDARLKAQGIDTVQKLWELEPTAARRIWGGIGGERFWYSLHGHDVPDIETERRSISHGHVLGPALRPVGAARGVMRRLTVKCGTRLRRMGYLTGCLSVFAEPENTERHSGWRRGGLSGERRFPSTANTFSMLEAADDIWEKFIRGIPASTRLRYVGVACTGLVKADEVQPDLFGWTPGVEHDPRDIKLLTAVDTLNMKYGKDTVTVGPQTAMAKFVGAKIAFNRIPDKAEFRE
jgi:DNA polymerase-4